MPPCQLVLEDVPSQPVLDMRPFGRILHLVNEHERRIVGTQLRTRSVIERVGPVDERLLHTDDHRRSIDWSCVLVSIDELYAALRRW